MGSIHDWIGHSATTITWWQMVIRGVLIFFAALILIEVGGRKAFGKRTMFDIVLAVMLGSVLSRALTGNARFFPTLAASAALVGLHLGLARAVFWRQELSRWIKGDEILLVENGTIQWPAMRRASITEHDLMEALRTNAGSDDLSRVRVAYLERNGKISFVMG